MIDPEQSLYHRLGGYDMISAIVDELHPRLEQDPQLSIYWRGKCDDSLRRDRQIVIDFLCAALGGPLAYRGRDMKTSHQGLAISESDWDVFARITGETLDKLGVAGREKNDFLMAADSLKADILETRSAARVRA